MHSQSVRSPLLRRSLARSLRPLALIIALGVAFVACSDGDKDKPVLLEGRDGGTPGTPGTESPGATPGANPGGTQGTSGPGVGMPGTGAAAVGPPWLQPPADCAPSETSIYVTGLILDMSTGEASCERSILVCGDSMTSERRYDSRTESCPWSSSGRAAISFSEPGPRVCCRDWEAAKRSGTPCDPRADADCDGIPNDEDREPLTPATAG